jgi:hypothetical protein
MEEESAPMDDLITLYDAKLASANTYDDIAAFLAIQKPFPSYLYYHLQYFYCTEKLRSTILEASNENVIISIINNKIPSFRFLFKKYHKKVEASFTIMSSSVQNLFILSSLCYSFEWNAIVDNLLKNRYPKIVFFYWKQRDLNKALKILEGSLRANYTLLIKELSIKEKREKQANSEDSRKKPAPDNYDSLREWTSKPLSQVLDEALEREQWFKKIKFQLYKCSNNIPYPEPAATCNISKFGSISFDNLYEVFTSYLCKELEPSFETSIRLYTKRGLSERDSIPSKPIAIEFDYDIFTKDHNLFVFKKLIERFPYSSKAIYHSNPYFHASIADFKDSSSYDVFISNPKRLLIIPKIRTSIEALERFVSFILYEFHEGTVKEMDEKWLTA